MSLIAILISLLVERYLGALEQVRRYEWFDRFADALLDRLPTGGPWAGTAGLLAVVFPPLLLAGAMQYAFGELSLLLAFIYAVLMLLYTLGPRDLEAQVEAYADATERGDTDSARWYAGELLGTVPQTPSAEEEALVETVLVEANDRLLGVFFWFVLLGPVGALLFRLSILLEQKLDGGETADAARRLYGILSWPTARLCAFGYGLSGRFVEAMVHWRRRALEWPDHNRGVLVSTGFGALDYTPDPAAQAVDPAPVKEALGLVRRTVWLWLTVLALLTLGGWAG